MDLLVGHRLRAPGIALALAGVLHGALAVRSAEARVNPLMVIERQIHKANVLMVLDTSGSMTGVPGGVFTYSSEAGVDCDNGMNCRQGGVAGVCKAASTRSCLSDDDCRRGYCEKDPTRPCQADPDCPTAGAKCSFTGQACAQDSDCPPQPGRCSTTGLPCDGASPCAVIGKCKYGGDVCANPGGKCPDQGVCSQDATRKCTTNADCPQAASGGSCASGGTPPSGCSTQDDCPSKQKCANTDETCRATAECPGASKGRCSGSGATCQNSNSCPAGETCVMWSNPCMGPPNPCLLPHTPCNVQRNNDCEAVSNTCNPTPNTCVQPPGDRCIQPASVTDTCEPSARGVPGPIRMCRIAQTVCSKNADCPAAGDSCGPATSRMVIAKRAINTVVTSHYDIVNFGFMTFFQDGYYPYFEATGGNTTGTVTEFQSVDKLKTAGCFDLAWGPTPECTIAGTKMKLRPTVNSRYTVRTGPTSYVDVDQSYCGMFCDIKPSIGTGEYQGSYYQYDGAPGGNSTNKVEQEKYIGKSYTGSDGKTYTYYQALPNYYNGGLPPPFSFTDCEQTNVCGAKCGGRWDPDLAPFLYTQDDKNLDKARDNALKLSARLEPASYGGLMAYWATPVGCTLENDVAKTPGTSAFHYMEAVKSGDGGAIAKDPLPCRQNFVVFISDGAANGPGDIDANGVSICDKPECAAANPETAGCECRSVMAAWNMRQKLGVRTFVVGFSGDVAAGPPRVINDNIARAGGTDAGNDGIAPFALLAQNEDELVAALQTAIYDAVKGSYSTAPTSSSAGVQQTFSVTEGKYALDSRMDFPSWKGHLLAYDLSGGSPVLYWDAATKLDQANWWERRIYTWDHRDGYKKFRRVEIDAATKELKNKADWVALGLGANEAEAEAVARWMMGDPLYKNPSRLGAIINSTPIDVGSPGDSPLPGGHQFFVKHKDRPHLVYVGSDDGMLHSFFLDRTTVGDKTYEAGAEAFAFIPPGRPATIRSLYAQGGQKADPAKHLFGLAQSPKVKSLCVESCSDPDLAKWRTLMIMTEGYGGTEAFVLDITEPFGTTGLNEPPLSDFRWHTAHVAKSGDLDSALGLTISLPAFFVKRTDGMDEYHLIFASGYPPTTSATQGRKLVTARAWTGDTTSLDVPASPVGPCSQEYSVLTDVGTARDFGRNEMAKLLAGYFGDTWGNLWRYVDGKIQLVTSFGCDSPLHFSPTVAQLDRDDPSYDENRRKVYPVQVTNSALDSVTEDLGPSKLVFMKEKTEDDPDGKPVIKLDSTFGSAGKIELQVGRGTEICSETLVAEDGKTVTCKTPMPDGARPTATPLGILRKNADGFQVLTVWYVPSTSGCSKGVSYLTAHQMLDGVVTQRYGGKVSDEPVTSPVVLGGRVYVFGSGGAIHVTDFGPDILVGGPARPPRPYDGSYSKLSWTEVP